jgi:hypothetical protein
MRHPDLTAWSDPRRTNTSKTIVPTAGRMNGGGKMERTQPATGVGVSIDEVLKRRPPHDSRRPDRPS